MAKAVKKKAEKKTPKEASSLFHNIMGASVTGNPKPNGKKKKGAHKMVHHPLEIFTGVNLEKFQIRIVDTGLVINAEINLQYMEGEEEKSLHFRTDQYAVGTPIEDIRQKIRANLQTITIINRTAEDARIADIFPLPKKENKKE